MMTMQKLEQKLQKADRKQAGLYLLCNFIALMLISAYSAMMFSPTVLTILPEGGDSRKQIVAIFILALFGCVIFTIYAANLFFRKKSPAHTCLTDTHGEFTLLCSYFISLRFPCLLCCPEYLNSYHCSHPDSDFPSSYLQQVHSSGNR